MASKRGVRITRDLVLFTVGLAGVIYETLRQTGNERPALLALFGGMMGLGVLGRLVPTPKPQRREGDNP